MNELRAWPVGGGETGALIRARDWSRTPLGPRERWPQSLRTAVDIMLGSPAPTSVLCGPEHVHLYNDAYIGIAQERHPAIFGRPALENWSEAQDVLRPLFDGIMAGGPPAVMQDQRIPLRPGDGTGRAERVFRATFSPIPGESGPVGGIFHPLQETTGAAQAREALDASEERSRLVVESARDYAILTTDPEGRIESWSPGAEAVFGWTRAEALGRPAAMTFTPEDQAGGRPQEERDVARARGFAPDVRWHQRKDGSRVFIEGVARVLRGPEGEVRGFLKIGQDVTARRRAEQERERLLDAVLRSEQRHRLVNLATNDVIWEWDLATNSLVWNEAIATMFGYAPETVPPGIDFWYEHIHPDDRARVTEGIHAAIDGRGSTWSDEYRFLSVDGSYATVLDRGVIARDDAGNATRMTGSMLDLTERERLLASERAARAEAEAANQAKADFLASMSHELRTPLNAIGGYVDLLDLGVHGPLTDAQREALSRVAANQRHLLTLINDVLAFAKLEAGQVEFDLRPLAACELIAGVEPLVGPLAQAKGIALSARECDPGLRVLGDEERVRQVLLNLVGNAIKFTPEGGWVLLSCEARGEWTEIHVRDNGPGISAEKQQRIFDPFVQVDRRLNRPHEGVGLGLAISRDLARAMGGELGVESTEGGGSTFRLRLPRPARAGS